MADLRLLILTDWRGLVPQRAGGDNEGIDLDVLEARCNAVGVQSRRATYEQVSTDPSMVTGFSHAYAASSQHRGYKAAVLNHLALLRELGVTLIPAYEHYLAHNNKAYQALRLAHTSIPHPESTVISTVDQGLEYAVTHPVPFVAKSSWGCGSDGVALIRSLADAKRFLATYLELPRAEPTLSRIRRAKGHVQHWLRQRRQARLGAVVFQEFIPDLRGDWRVQTYGPEAVALARANRPHDFRASGSGLSEWRDPPEDILPFAAGVADTLALPWASLDIGIAPSGPVLIEYQATHHCLNSAINAPHHYRMEPPGAPRRISGPIDVDRAIADRIISVMSA